MAQNVIPFFINTMDFIYVFFVLTIIYYSLNLSYSNKRFKTLLYLGSTALGIFSLVVFVVLLRDLFGIHDEKCTPFLIKIFCSKNSSIFPKESILTL